MEGASDTRWVVATIETRSIFEQLFSRCSAVNSP